MPGSEWLDDESGWVAFRDQSESHLLSISPRSRASGCIRSRRLQNSFDKNFACLPAKSQRFILADCPGCRLLSAGNNKFRYRCSPQFGSPLDQPLLIGGHSGFKAAFFAGMLSDFCQLCHSFYCTDNRRTNSRQLYPAYSIRNNCIGSTEAALRAGK